MATFMHLREEERRMPAGERRRGWKRTGEKKEFEFRDDGVY